MVSARDTAISLHTPVPCTVLHEKFQFWERGILGELRTEVPKSSMRNSNLEGGGVITTHGRNWRGGGMHGRGTCMMGGGHVWRRGGGHVWQRGSCMVGACVKERQPLKWAVHILLEFILVLVSFCPKCRGRGYSLPRIECSV